MKKAVILPVFLSFVLVLSSLMQAIAADSDSEPWSFMPAGAKQSYMGIHGGTMPVSLLVSADGASLLSFVGRTGDDFIEALRKARLPVPSFSNATSSGKPHAKGGAALFAGNATATLPVFAFSGSILPSSSFSAHLEPFGLSREPASIEGEVAKPRKFPHARSARLFRLPDYFQPRRAQK